VVVIALILWRPSIVVTQNTCSSIVLYISFHLLQHFFIAFVTLYFDKLFLVIDNLI